MNLNSIYRFAIRNWYWIYPVLERVYRHIELLLLNKETMKRAGIFTPAQEKFIAKAIRKGVVQPKNKIIKWFMSYALLYFIKAVDNFGFDRISREWKLKLLPIIDAGMDGKHEQVRRYATDLLNEKVDFRGIPEETELRWFDSITRFIAATIDLFVQKQYLKKL